MDERKQLIGFSVGNGLRNDEDDVRKVKFELAKRNFYNHPVENGIIDKSLTEAIKDFQRGKGLKVDGLMNPEGETERNLVEAADPTHVKNIDTARRDQIINNKNDFRFKVTNPFTYSDTPQWDKFKDDVVLHFRRSPRLDVFQEVTKNNDIIERVSKRNGVDPDLVRSIAYLETAHGYYDSAHALFDKNDSIRPMNVKYSLWNSLGYSRDDLKRPDSNIEAGIKIIKGIQDRSTNKNIDAIATLYQNLGAKDVSIYGRRVKSIYDEKPWRR